MSPSSTPVGVTRLLTLAALSVTPCTSALVPISIIQPGPGVSTTTTTITVTKNFPVLPTPLPNSTVIIPVSDDGPPSDASVNNSTLRIVDDDPVYKYAGCWTDTSEFPGGAHALDGPSQTLSTSMTVAKCIKFCSTAKNPNNKNPSDNSKSQGQNQTEGWPIAAVEHSQECYCGSAISRHSFNLRDSVCDTPCSGSNTTACGGNLALSVYNVTVKEDNPGDGDEPLPEPPHNKDGDSNDDAEKDEAVLQAVGVGILVVAMSLAIGAGLL